ncbi:unnamed protein product [Didymodactylos carnosus]|uniref:Sodium/hydrogen exchanger n=1 Tax=Didymodactylos carnosus TaxID=1234261 RepID=A0A814YBR0_9BILA|nr:unnamed protein product [Didymodactylos carnosus]CAF1228289.1 unnamed protein product [Didymodactylos carnosus]CAF3746787.1 unnamed protein product [Didymodactylos carnosus]CAF3991073.1 unnamed protein product [Didymodactylos carnosus]
MIKTSIILLYVISSYLMIGIVSSSPPVTTSSNTNSTVAIPHFPITLTFSHVSNVFGICLWILLGILAKIVFHLSPGLTEKFPENCMLIILGLIVGILLFVTHLEQEKRIYILNSDTFFLFLLPPIVLETGYFMPKRAFFDNIGTILLLAVLNKLFNTMCIGLTLWGFAHTSLFGGTPFNLLECLLFASFITAVDPIAVLATFVEIRVNDTLYIVVFGESLLNDAVSIVLYRMFENFLKIGQKQLVPMDFFLGFLSFFVVTIGGTLIGLVFGFIACFTTKFTIRTPVLEPLVVFVYAYIAYLTAEMLGLSGILAITVCGMMMKQYIEYNITKKSMATIEYVLKMSSTIMETIIFMFMGLTTVSEEQSWNTGFVIVTVIACLLFRAIGVAFFANVANLWRLLALTRIDMLIMSYGGLRGALAFALALVLDENTTNRKREFITAAIVVVFFTVFIQGTTLGRLVKLLNVRQKQNEEPTMSATLTNRLMDHVMTCLESVSGVTGTNSLRDKFHKIDHNYFKKWLLREQPQEKLDIRLWQTFRNIDLQSAIKMHDQPNAIRKAANDVLVQSDKNARNPSIVVIPPSSMNLPISISPDDIYIDNPPTEKMNVKDLLSHHMPYARRRATIHAKSQDEAVDSLVNFQNQLRQLNRMQSLSPHSSEPESLSSTRRSSKAEGNTSPNLLSNWNSTSRKDSSRSGLLANVPEVDEKQKSHRQSHTRPLDDQHVRSRPLTDNTLQVQDWSPSRTRF